MLIFETQQFQKHAQEAATLAPPVMPVEEQPTPKGIKPHDLPYWWYKKHIRQIPDDPKMVWPLGDHKNIHGFYCGPGPIRDESCGKLADGKPLPAPQDPLDCACMEHDAEYCHSGIGWRQAYGFFLSPEASVADKRLIAKIKLLEKQKKLNWYATMKARMILGFFQSRQQLPKKDKNGNPIQAIQAIAHQVQPLPYDESEKPCTSCSRLAAKRQAELSANSE
jgi:hypothetical protein